MPALPPALLKLLESLPRPVLPVAVLLFVLNPAAATAAAPAPPPSATVPGEILVRLSPGAAAPVRGGTSSLERRLGGRDVRPLLQPATAANPAGEFTREPEDAGNRLARTFRITLDPGEDAAAVAGQVAGDPGVEYAGPVHLVPLAGMEPALVPDDPRLAEQWHHEAIGSFAAWDRTAGDPSVIVAVIDTGLDLEHPELAPNLWINASEAGGLPGVDDDGNGYVDDIHGFDFTDVPEIVGAGDFRDRDADPSDDVGHGTWVAGVVCARGNNGIGIAGVAYRSSLMVLRAGFRPRSGFSLGFLAEDDAAAAIVYAVDNGARILNLSFGDVVRAPILEDAVRYALARGAVVVAAAGNEGSDLPFYPAAMSGVLAVGASDRNGRRASFSTHGPAVKLLAPGAAILTTDLGGAYASKSGTSLASPVAAGAAALLAALHPGWSADQVVARLQSTAAAPDPAADARGARFLRLDPAMDAPAAAEARFIGLDDGDVVGESVTLRGRAAGPGVRGWRVSMRRSAAGSWKTLFAEPRGQAVDEVLGVWDTTAEPEGVATLRLEALGPDVPAAVREIRVTIDHTDPVVTNLRTFPVLFDGGYGVRVEAETDDPCRATLILDAGMRQENRGVFFSRTHIVGVDGPIPRTGLDVPVTLLFTNGAGRTTTVVDAIRLPDPDSAIITGSHEPAPGVRSWMQNSVDLDRDDRPDLLAELQPVPGRTYGEVVAFESSRSVSCPVCAVDPLEIVWRSGQEFIPLDAADMDGDGRPELLGLAFQEVRIYRAPGSGDYPSQLRWQTGEAWASRFIPRAAGTGHEVVASRDAEVRIYGVQDGDLRLSLTLTNPSSGGNAISPGIAAGDLDGDGRLSLVTLDGDGDLLTWTRSMNGMWESRPALRLTGSFLAPPVLVDLDRDGRDEIALLESVGGLPSPAGGIRDGYYRLSLYRFVEGMPTPWRDIAVAGYFPGNPVSLDAVDLDRDGGQELWLGVRQELHRIELRDGFLAGTGFWSGITPGRMAAGVMPGSGGPRSALYWPGPSGFGGPVGGPSSGGRVLTLPAAGLPALAVTGLRASEPEFSRNAVLIRLQWDPVGGPYTVLRTDPGRTPRLVYRGEEPAYPDTLIADFSYVYSVYAGALARPAELAVTATPGNPVVSAGIAGDAFEILWSVPIRPTEQSRIEIDGHDVRSALPDRGGLRLVIHPRTPIEPGGTYRIELYRYLSETNLPLRAPDDLIEITVPNPASFLKLVAVRPVDAATLELDLSPAAPIAALSTGFVVEPGIRVRSVERSGETRLRLFLDTATPIRAGRYTVRLAPDLVGPGGERVREGLGDALPFQLSPVAFPNPVRPEHESVRFDWLADGARVTVYDLVGRPVWSGTAGQNGHVVWDLKSVAGRDVSPGAYLYEVDGHFGDRGRIAIVR